MQPGWWQLAALLALASAKGASAHAPPPEPPLVQETPVESLAPACRTAAASLHFDFAGAAPSACAINGARDFTLLVTPEHSPPINPSPWYAFRYETDEGGPITVTLRYLAGQHRYVPKLADAGGEWRDLPVEPTQDGNGIVLRLPAGKGSVSAQERITPADASADLARWGGLAGAPPFLIGRSHDGRPIEAIRVGRADAPRLVLLLGRQHPPEVSGAIAMRAFVDALVEARARAPQDFADLQFLIVPMLNPDGVVRGHWRANRGGKDLNRDWGEFTQPETRSVKTWLDALPVGVRPVLMMDFHSTRSNLFYVQGQDEASAAQQRFLAAWLAGRDDAIPGYSFTIEPRNANPGTGTAKNWFHAAYGIPAYTYEVADEADRTATRAAARMLAQTLPEALTALAE